MVISTGFARAAKKCHTCQMCLGVTEQELRRNPSFIYRRGTILLKHSLSAPQLYQSNIQPRETSAVLLWVCMLNTCTKIAAPPCLNDCGLAGDSEGDPLLLLMSRNQHSHWHPNHVFMCSPHSDAYTHMLLLSQGITTCPSAKFFCKHLDTSMMFLMTPSTHFHSDATNLHRSAATPSISPLTRSN